MGATRDASSARTAWLSLAASTSVFFIAIVPSVSITNDQRFVVTVRTSCSVLPSISAETTFSPSVTGTPNASATLPSVSASSVKSRWCAFLKSWWFRTESPLTPTTVTPFSRSFCMSSRKPHACFVQPPVMSAG